MAKKPVKKSETTDSKRESPFWKPTKVGETIEGNFISYQETKISKGGGTKIGAAIVLETGKAGPNMIPISWSIINSEFRDIAPKLKPGAKLRFMFKGMGGRSKIIRIWVNGKEMENRSSFNVIEAEKIGSFFTA